MDLITASNIAWGLAAWFGASIVVSLGAGAILHQLRRNDPPDPNVNWPSMSATEYPEE